MFEVEHDVSQIVEAVAKDALRVCQEITSPFFSDPRAEKIRENVEKFSAIVLVQILQQAKLNLNLPVMLSKLDRYDLLMIDDLGYVKKSEAETLVLFELVAHCYECKSLMITANQPSSQWNSILADSTMTVAAIDA